MYNNNNNNVKPCATEKFFFEKKYDIKDICEK